MVPAVSEFPQILFYNFGPNYSDQVMFTLEGLINN